MKLAEALSQRADLQKRIHDLRSRMKDNAKVQEGTEPSEDPSALRVQFEECISRFEHLVYSINRTNMSTFSEDGKTLTALIARRDALTMKVGALKEVLNYARENSQRYSRSEIRIIRIVDVPQMTKEVDSLSKELRELDTLIQGMNWNTDLVEA